MLQQKHRVELLVDGVPYIVIIEPFTFNEETRYIVNYNGSPDYIFTWDSELKRLKAIGDDTSAIPESLEVAIAEKLQSGRH
jgi:hypothetical protein